MHDQNRAKLKLVNQYIIPFKGLKDGDHDFQFDFDQKFFDEHEVLEADGGDLKAVVYLNKKPNMLSLEVNIKGKIHIQCHRCLEYYDHPLRSRSDLIVKFGDNTADSNDEIWILHPSEYEINLEQYFFECIGLSLPIQRIHPDDEQDRPGCNPDMLNRLESLSVRPSKDEEEIDPRWNALKDLLNDTNNN